MGRDWFPFDRGPSVLWPLFVFAHRLVFECFPMELYCVVGFLVCLRKLLDELMSWRAHWLLAAVISDWNRAALRSKMKKAGIKFSPRPLPPKLAVLPCNLMVLSGVMLSMWSVAMAGVPPPKPPPVTWVEAFGAVRDLSYPPLWVLKKPRKPPDPRPQMQVFPPSVDEREKEQWLGQRSIN